MLSICVSMKCPSPRHFCMRGAVTWRVLIGACLLVSIISLGVVDASVDGVTITDTDNVAMEGGLFGKQSLENFKWLNEPVKWKVTDETLEVTTENKTDFWQGTWYNFHYNTGHVYGIEIQEDFTFTACVEADFEELYDQAGLMIYLDEKHWVKTGLEFNDGQPMIGSVVTNEVSDWATGIYTGDPRKFYIRLSRVKNVVCIKYSTDNITWSLLRLCPFPEAKSYFVGLMSCTPQRSGLDVKFSNITISEPVEDILHSN